MEDIKDAAIIANCHHFILNLPKVTGGDTFTNEINLN